MFDLYSTKTQIIKILETEKVSILKLEFIKMNNLMTNKIKIRFFFAGTELNDNNELFNYNIIFCFKKIFSLQNKFAVRKCLLSQ